MWWRDLPGRTGSSHLRLPGSQQPLCIGLTKARLFNLSSTWTHVHLSLFSLVFMSNGFMHFLRPSLHSPPQDILVMPTTASRAPLSSQFKLKSIQESTSMKEEFEWAFIVSSKWVTRDWLFPQTKILVYHRQFMQLSLLVLEIASSSRVIIQ